MWVTYSKNVDRTNRMYRLNRIYMKSAWNNQEDEVGQALSCIDMADEVGQVLSCIDMADDVGQALSCIDMADDVRKLESREINDLLMKFGKN